MNIIKKIKKLCYTSITKNFKFLQDFENEKNISISASKNENISHFQFNDAMKLSKIINQDPIKIANTIKNNIEKNNIFKEISVTNPGFVNFKIKNEYIIKNIKTILKSKRNGIKKTKTKKNIIVDYSSPNIAKEMHVGHLRSTIIGDFISNLLEYQGHNVFRISHLGDWGTQFGMLIAYIKKYKKKNNINIKNISRLYIKAYKKFKKKKNFYIKSKKEVIKLQKGNKKSIKIWKKINLISQVEYEKIYKLLNIKLINIGESYYKNTLKKVISILKKKKLITISKNTKCINLEKKKDYNSEPPIIIQKSDGGYNYSSTEITALYYRINIQKANWIIYVTDIGQENHFKMITELAKKSSILKNNVKITHIKFGFILEKNGQKIKTRSGSNEKLINLLNTAIKEAKNIINEKKKSNKKYINIKAKKLGINAIKYADLSNNMLQNYKFDIKNMLNFNGNTAAFITYAYARIMNIKKKIQQNSTYDNDNKLKLTDKVEISLCIHIMQYEEIINKTTSSLNPNLLTNYIYILAKKFHLFFHTCKILNCEFQNNRIIICEVCRKIIKQSLKFLGLKTLNEM